MNGARLNRIALSILSPLLIVAGIAGFVLPQQYSLTSNATPYNLFHIVFGAIGLFIVSTRDLRSPVFFNLALGIIDLYQAVASIFGLWPIQYFFWTAIDDVLHVLLGVGLILLGRYGWQSLKTDTA